MLPVVDKPTLMNSFDDWVTDPVVTAHRARGFLADATLIGQRLQGRYRVATTSGTSGIRGIFVLDQRSLHVATAMGLRMLTSWLTAPQLLRIVRGGARVSMVAATGGHFASAVAAAGIRANPLRRRLVSVLSVQTPLPALVDQLNRAQPTILAPYATTAALLATEQQAGRLQINPALIVLSAEGLPDGEQQRISGAFQAPVVSSYAATECPFLSSSCSDGWHHVNADWAILEPVTADHQPVPPGQVSDTVLLTNLANRIQPVLRYDLGDQVLQNPDPCACGSPLPAIRVRGRTTGALTFPGANGPPVTLPPLVLSSVADRTAGIELAQFVQVTPTTLQVRMRAESGAADTAWTALSSAISKVLADNELSHVSVQRSAEEPQQTAGGTYRRVVPFVESR